MVIWTKERYFGVVLKLQGRFVGHAHGARLHAQIDRLLAAGERRVVVDLERCTFLDSSALGDLIGAQTRLRRSGGDLRLAALSPETGRLLGTTGMLGPVFDAYAGVDEALVSFSLRPSSALADA